VLSPSGVERRAEPSSKIVPLSRLLSIRQRLRESQQTVVFTNGCFDLLHVGHVRFLVEARALGDVLVVAVNSDSSVRRIKGAGRPIVPERERAEIVAALEAVDLVVRFSDTTAAGLVTALEPDIVCKGGDYDEAEALPEATAAASFGGRFLLLSRTHARSTSELVERISKEAAW
jgi:D-glycero-beta-D-manno-heptose 1-phosphate adenylyltransferase